VGPRQNELYYDAAGRLATVTDPRGFTVAYRDGSGNSGYDAAGNVIYITYPGNKPVGYTYDSLNRLETVTNWLGQIATYHYDDAGRCTGLTNFNNTYVSFTPDDANRITGIGITRPDSSVIAQYSYTPDGNGNRQFENRTAPLLPSGTTTTAVPYSYNTYKNRLNSAGSASFAYDNEGQLQTGYGSTYTFDYEHRLTGIGATSFTYNGKGDRLQVTRGGTVTKYIYDARGNILAEADASNNITRYYIYGAGLLGMITAANASYCYHYDGNANTIAITDAGRNVVNAYAYDPFGKVLNQFEAVAQPFKFVGQFGVMAEPEGFYYMRARYYDPVVGRFISEDPIGFGGGDVNLYAYVKNNVIMLNDPLGLAAGDPYKTANAAALAARADIYSRVGKNQSLSVEFGGYIYKMSNAGYSYTEPRTDYSWETVWQGEVPNGAVASYHNHLPLPGYRYWLFSDDDIRIDKA
jgi:RHS repeat-associated protein